MPLSAIQPFYDFVANLNASTVAAKAELVEFDFVPGAAGAQEIREHLVDYYDGVEAVHSFRDEQGRIVDCVPIDRQPAARLNDGAAPVPPLPDAPTPEFEQLMEAQRAATRDEETGSCPEGAVPLLRLTLEEAGRYANLEDFLQLGERRKHKPPTPEPRAEKALAADDVADFPHRYAVGYQQVANLGGRSCINLWKPALQGQEIMSLSQIWCSAGSDKDGTLQTAEAGWQVCPNNFPLSGAAPVFFIYWTGDNYATTGAYNNRDGKFYLKSSVFPIGGIFNATSATGGAQYDIDVSYIYAGGNWWLYVGGVALGCWQAPVYGQGPMSHGAQEIMFGGETDGANDYPPMGSGAFPNGGYGAAAYHRNITYLDMNGHAQSAHLAPLAQTPADYMISLQQPAAPPGNAWGSYFYFGGPGGA